MKRLVIIAMMLVGCLIHPNATGAQQIKDALVLVDVSGTMKYSQINDEAKNIISQMLQGTFQLSNFNGWSIVQNGNCALISGDKTSLASAGGKVCIVPFGNVNRFEDYKFVDMSNFGSSFENNFPTSFRDAWTYSTLAQAYAAHIASNNGMLGKVYMIIYTDGRPESVAGDTPAQYKPIIDAFQTTNATLLQKIGIVRKSFHNNNFDIQIWTMGITPPVCSKCGKNPCVCEKTVSTTPEIKRKIEITSPTEGKNIKSSITIKVNESVTVKWKNATGSPKINVKKKNGDKYSSKAQTGKDYDLEQKNNTAKITFYEPQDYEIIVGDTNSRAMRYVKVEKDLLNDLFPFIIIVILIIVGVLLWQTVSKKDDPTPGPTYGPTPGSKEDWT